MRGGMAEWTMAAVLKTAGGESLPWVRILLPPPSTTKRIGAFLSGINHEYLEYMRKGIRGYFIENNLV